MLVATGISKTFGQHLVLSDINLRLDSGSVTALLGSNGAGKSTLLRVLGGVLKPTAGTVTAGESRQPIFSVVSAMRAGIRSAHQEGSLIPAWKVREHFPAPSGVGAKPWSHLAPEVEGDASVETLRPSDRQLLEVARALYFDPSVLLADEPTAGLGQTEKERVFHALADSAQRGAAVLLTTHDLNAALLHSNNVIVLREGRVSLLAPSRDCTLNRILQAMGGMPRQRQGVDRSVLAGTRPSLLITMRQSEAAFRVSAGEIVGLSGFSRSAKDLLRAIYGLSYSFEVKVDLDSRPLPRSPGKLFASGIVYVSRDRYSEWSFGGQTVEFNLVAAILKKASTMGNLNSRVLGSCAQKLQEQFEISTRSLQTDIDALSGGNRQRTVLARAVAAGPQFLLMDEPFSGVDQLARSKLFTVFRRLAQEGSGILIYSQELGDLIDATDRIVVCGDDATMTEFSSSEIDPTRLEKALTAAHAHTDSELSQ